MQVLVISDTHGDLSGMEEILIRKIPFQAIFHLGDFLKDGLAIRRMTDKPLLGVKGNCDFMSAGRDEILESVEGNRILLTHGHRYDVKISYQKLFYRAKEKNADLVLFGHTHIPAEFTMEGITFFNPGSLSRPKSGSGRGFAILEAKDGRFTIENYSL